MKVFVTGASSGVGKATAELLHLKGCLVHGLATKAKPLDCTWNWHRVDLSDPEQRQSLDQELLASMDVLVLNAGLGELGSVEDTPLAQSRYLFEVNYWANVDLVKKVLPFWRQRGSGKLIVLGSIVTELHFPFKAQYSASKAALTAFLDSLRYEVEEYGIEIQVLEPGWIRSDFHNRLQPVQVNDSPYSDRYKPFLDFKNDANPKYPDGSSIAQLIWNLIQKGGAFRQAVGPDAKAFFLFGRALPYKVREWLVRRLSASKKK